MSGAGREGRRPKGRKARVDTQRAEAAKLRAEGLTLKAIGERLGTSRQRVFQLLQPVPANHCRACGGPVERQLRYHPECRPSNYTPTGAARGKKRVDLTGRRFGRWTVLAVADRLRWLCRCRCGVEKPVLAHALKAGTSLGCRSCRAKGEKR